MSERLRAQLYAAALRRWRNSPVARVSCISLNPGYADILLLASRPATEIWSSGFYISVTNDSSDSCDRAAHIDGPLDLNWLSRVMHDIGQNGRHKHKGNSHAPT
jgi:hypothetical protein